MNDGTPTARQQLRRMAEGCHDTLSAFAPYRMAHGGYWLRHEYAGWYTTDRHRYEALTSGSVTGRILAGEDHTDPWQIWGVRIVTAIIAASGVMVAVILS